VTKNDFVVWMPYNLLAFSIIPAVLRPTTTAAMEASWQTYITVVCDITTTIVRKNSLTIAWKYR